jgi:hypothetical protein
LFAAGLLFDSGSDFQIRAYLIASEKRNERCDDVVVGRKRRRKKEKFCRSRQVRERRGDEDCCGKDRRHLASVLGGFRPVIVLSYDGPLFVSFFSFFLWRSMAGLAGGAIVSFCRTMDVDVDINLYLRHAIVMKRGVLSHKKAKESPKKKTEVRKVDPHDRA